MNKVLNRIKSFNFPTYTVPVFCFFCCVISFGLLIPWIGFYWDDWHLPGSPNSSVLADLRIIFPPTGGVGTALSNHHPHPGRKPLALAGICPFLALGQCGGPMGTGPPAVAEQKRPRYGSVLCLQSIRASPNSISPSPTGLFTSFTACFSSLRHSPCWLCGESSITGSGPRSPLLSLCLTCLPWNIFSSWKWCASP